MSALLDTRVIDLVAAARPNFMKVLGIPCLTLRTNTERSVTVSHGTNTVVGQETARVGPLVEEILAGRAAERVVAALLERYGG